MEAARREGALQSLTFRLVESLMPAIYAQNGCHKCLSLSILNDKMGENEVKCSGILCVGSRPVYENPFCHSFAHVKENGAVYAIRIIILEIRIRKLSA